jgi:hypothetical protein
MQALLSRPSKSAGTRRRGRAGAAPPRPEVLRSAAFYRLHSELGAPDAPHSLLAHSLAASSTGAHLLS